MNIEKKVEHSLNRLIEYIETEQFKGWDPYDALNSPILWYLSLGNKWIRVAYTQALKKCPVNFRKLFFIQKGYNPKGLGLFLAGYIKLLEMDKKKIYDEKIYQIVEILESLKSPNRSGYCWGYNFPWQNRDGYSPAYRPTSVNTSFIGRAFLDGYQVTGQKKYLDIARSSCEFILNDLKIMRETDTELVLSYNTEDEERIYNSNMLSAALLARVFEHTKEKHLLNTAQKIANFVVRAQRPDGSWHYGEIETEKWIDLHHTAYVLESLYDFAVIAQQDTLMSVLEKGLNFFVNTFFHENGRPKLWHNKDYPTDIHAMAGVIALVKLKNLYDYEELLEKTVTWMVDHMQDNRGFFYYRMGRCLPNKIPFIRWSQAWAFCGLTSYLAYLRKK